MKTAFQYAEEHPMILVLKNSTTCDFFEIFFAPLDVFI